MSIPNPDKKTGGSKGPGRRVPWHPGTFGPSRLLAMAFFCLPIVLFAPTAFRIHIFPGAAHASPDAMATNSSKEWTKKAADYAKLGKDKQAIECLEIALDLNPHNPEAQNLFNRLKTGEPGPRAIKATAVKVPEKTDEAKQLFERARMHLSKGDLHQARNCLEIALELDEMNFEIKAELDKVVQRIKFERYRDTGGDPELANMVAAAPKERYHVVEKGDTLGKLAKKYLGSFNDYKKIADFNRFKPTATLSVGQRIAIPPDELEPGIFLGGKTAGKAAGQDSHCPLPTTAHCPLPTAHCPLPTAHCPLPTAPKVLPFGDGRPGGGIRVIREFESSRPALSRGFGENPTQELSGAEIAAGTGRNARGNMPPAGKNIVSYDVIEVEAPKPYPGPDGGKASASAKPAGSDGAGLKANSGWTERSWNAAVPAERTALPPAGTEKVPVIFYKPIPPLPPAKVKKDYTEPKPVSATDYHDLAAAQWKAGELEKAMDLYMKAVKLDPTFLLKGRTKLVDDAILMLKGTTPSDPKSFAQLHYRLGSMNQKRGDFTEAETEYQRAIELNPSFEEAWFSLGFIYEKTGRPDLAIETYEKVNEIFSSRDEIVDLATGRITALVDKGKDR